MDDAWLDSFAAGHGRRRLSRLRPQREPLRRGPGRDQPPAPRPGRRAPPLRLVRPPHPRQPRHLAHPLRLSPRRPGRGLPGRLLLRPDRQPGLGGDRARRRAAPATAGAQAALPQGDLARLPARQGRRLAARRGLRDPDERAARRRPRRASASRRRPSTTPSREIGATLPARACSRFSGGRPERRRRECFT